MASKKADKSYPPGQKPSSLPAKPTMAQAFQAAQGPAVARPTAGSSSTGQGAAVARPYGPGNPKETPSYFPKGTATGKASQPKDTRSAAQRIVEAGQASMKPKSVPVPPKESADVAAQKRAADVKANAARMAKDLAVGSKVVKKAASTTPASPAAKPYVKLKDASREAARRAYVQKQLDRLGIKSAAGKPRSAKEKAARAKARATWDKKNPFVPKKKGTGDMGSPSDAARERRPEA